MPLSEFNQKEIINHAQACAPNECAGFIVSDHMDGFTGLTFKTVC